MKTHNYKATIKWTGNQGTGTSGYTEYSRDHQITVNGKSQYINGSSDPAFRGDPSRFNPEELFLSSLSTCHMLWYLHLCSSHNIIVKTYADQAKGVMQEENNGIGKFTSVTLFPDVTISNSNNIELAQSLHQKANAMCFIANSCNFNIGHKPSIKVG